MTTTDRAADNISFATSEMPIKDSRRTAESLRRAFTSYSRVLISLPEKIHTDTIRTFQEKETHDYILDCGFEFTPSPFHVSTRWQALRIGPSRGLNLFLEWRCPMSRTFSLLDDQSQEGTRISPWGSVKGMRVHARKEFTSWLCVRSLFARWVRIGGFVLPFIPKICSALILISRLDTKIRSDANFRLEF